jgi:hypothetical protein
MSGWRNDWHHVCGGCVVGSGAKVRVYMSFNLAFGGYSSGLILGVGQVIEAIRRPHRSRLKGLMPGITGSRRSRRGRACRVVALEELELCAQMLLYLEGLVLANALRSCDNGN